MSPEQLTLAGASFNATLGVFHLGFWRLFRWGDELPRLGPINRGVMQVLNLMLAYVFFAVAAAQWFLAPAWTTTPLGRVGTGMVAGFWFLRALLQPFFWPRVRVSWAMFGLFLLGAALHALALTRNAAS